MFTVKLVETNNNRLKPMKTLRKRRTEATEPTTAMPPSQLVHFELVNVQAESVCIAGSFNAWHPSVTPMLAIADGRWAKELALASGTYEYRFVVDGQWTHDSRATEAAINPYGGLNSVLRVTALGGCAPV